MAARWRTDLLENVIPFWERHSIDEEHGGTFTALDEDGSLLEPTKFMWLQGRAVYMWSKLHNELRDEVDATTADRWFAHARSGANFLAHAKRPDGTLAFAVSRDGHTQLHFQRKPYAAVFYVLGCLEYSQALRVRTDAGLDTHAQTPEPWLTEALEYFEKLRIWIDNPSTLGRTGAPAEATRSSNSADEGASSQTSSLADVMCLAGLAEEFLAKLPEQRERWMAHVHDA